eukprot:363066-Chlamydomonas_euryale.AAC.16
MSTSSRRSGHAHIQRAHIQHAHNRNEHTTQEHMGEEDFRQNAMHTFGMASTDAMNTFYKSASGISPPDDASPLGMRTVSPAARRAPPPLNPCIALTTQAAQLTPARLYAYLPAYAHACTPACTPVSPQDLLGLGFRRGLGLPGKGRPRPACGDIRGGASAGEWRGDLGRRPGPQDAGRDTSSALGGAGLSGRALAQCGDAGLGGIEQAQWARNAPAISPPCPSSRPPRRDATSEPAARHLRSRRRRGLLGAPAMQYESCGTGCQQRGAAECRRHRDGRHGPLGRHWSERRRRTEVKGT